MVLPFLAALAPFAPIVGGLIGAAGALMAPKPKPVTNTVSNSIDLVRLRDDAEKAGFNPLTIIRGGGLAGYGTSVSTGSAAADTRLSDALQTFGSGVAQWQYDPYGEAKSLSELALAKAQIQAFARDGSAPANLSLGGVPSASGSLPGAGSGATGWRFLGVDVAGNPITSDAQVAENRHGDLVGSIWGVGTLVSDIGKWVWDQGQGPGAALGRTAFEIERWWNARGPSGPVPHVGLGGGIDPAYSTPSGW